MNSYDTRQGSIKSSNHAVIVIYMRFNYRYLPLQHVLTKPNMDLLQRSSSPITHIAPFCIRNVHVCIFLLQNGELWDICLICCAICEMSLLNTGAGCLTNNVDQTLQRTLGCLL